MSCVLVEKPLPHVSCITLNRPERMNAMAFDVMVPFKEALEEVSFDNDTRVVIITGAGEGFCSGADLEDSGWMDIFDGLDRTRHRPARHAHPRRCGENDSRLAPAGHRRH